MGASFRKFLQVLQVFCKFLQGFALFIFSFYVFCFCFFLFYFFINLFYFDTLREQNPYFLALCKKTNPDFFGTLWLFWHFARTLTRLSQFLNLQDTNSYFREMKIWGFVYFFLLVCLHFCFFVCFFLLIFLIFILFYLFLTFSKLCDFSGTLQNFSGNLQEHQHFWEMVFFYFFTSLLFLGSI